MTDERPQDSGTCGRRFPPQPGTVLLAAEAAGWPRAKVNTLTLEGAEAWRKALNGCPPPTPGEVRLLLEGLGMPWLCDELLAGAGRERLRAWIAAGSVAPTPDRLVRELRYLGCEPVRAVVLVALLERVAPPAAAYLLENYTFLSVGATARGWCIQVAPDSVTGKIILLDGSLQDGEALLDVMLHEAAHGFLLAEPKEPIAAAALYNEVSAALIAAAKRPDKLQRWLRDQARDEKAADKLAAVWGGHLSCSAERAREHTLATARELHETYGGGAAADTERDAP